MRTEPNALDYVAMLLIVAGLGCGVFAAFAFAPSQGSLHIADCPCDLCIRE